MGNLPPADTLINDLSLSDSEDDDEDGGGDEVGGGGGESLDQDEGPSNGTGSTKAAKRDAKDEEDNSDTMDGKDETDAESQSNKASEEEDFDSDLEKSLKRRREESNELLKLVFSLKIISLVIN